MATILLVCTGNICRSPMAEGLIRRRLADRDAAEVEVESAGVSGWDESPATEEAVQALAELDLDITGHRARRLTSRLVDRADLVVAMAGEHRDAVIRAAPSAAPRTFTLSELVRLLEAEGDLDGSGSPAERIRARVERADTRRTAEPESAGDEDIGDPLGRGLDAYRSTARMLEELTARMVAGLLGQHQQRGVSRATEGGAA